MPNYPNPLTSLSQAQQELRSDIDQRDHLTSQQALITNAEFEKLLNQFTEFMTLGFEDNPSVTLVHLSYQPLRKLRVVSPNMLPDELGRSSLKDAQLDYAQRRSVLVEHDASDTGYLELEQRILEDGIDLWLGINPPRNKTIDYLAPPRYLAKIAAIIPKTTTITEIQLSHPITVEDIQDENTARNIMKSYPPGQMSMEQASLVMLQGDIARIHFAPQDATEVMTASSRFIYNSLDNIEDWYEQGDALANEYLNTSIASIACCVIQTLGAYNASRRSRGDNEVINRVEEKLDDLILALQILLTLAGASSRWGISGIMSLILNLVPMIWNSLVTAAGSAMFIVVKTILLQILTNIQNEYFKVLEKSEQGGTDQENRKALTLALARCFNLDYLFLKMARKALTWVEDQLRPVITKINQSLVMPDFMAYGPAEEQRGPLGYLMYIKLILDIIKNIDLAVERGELCYNRGYTDIPLLSTADSSEGTLQPGDILYNPIDNEEADSLGQQTGLGTDPGQGQAGVDGNDYIESLFDNSIPRGSSQSSNKTNTGLYGPTEDEMVNFLESYLNVPRADAIAAVKQSRPGSCKESLTQDEAGILGAVLNQVGLEL